MKSPGAAFALGYVALVMTGLAAIEIRAHLRPYPPCETVVCSARAPHPGYDVTRSLPQWHRLRAEDFEPADGVDSTLKIYLPDAAKYVGKYLADSKQRGWPLRPDGLSDHPWVTVPANRTSLSIPIFGDDALVKKLGVGWKVDLCDDSDCPVRSADVLALDCLDLKDTRCSVILSLGHGDRQKYDSFSKKQALAVVIHSASK